MLTLMHRDQKYIIYQKLFKLNKNKLKLKLTKVVADLAFSLKKRALQENAFIIWFRQLISDRLLT